MLCRACSCARRLCRPHASRCTSPYPILVMARELVARGASDWTRRCHLLPAAYVASLCTQNTTRIPTALRTALGSQNEFYLHTVHLVTFAQWPTEVRVLYSQSFLPHKAVTSPLTQRRWRPPSQKTGTTSSHQPPLIRTGYLLFHIIC